jgi:hypothetical protein
MGEEAGHYYDNSGYEFSHILKDVSGQTSIVYRYYDNWSPLVNKTDEYWTTEDISKSRFHGQIFAISSISRETQYISYSKGKPDVDVSLNKYINESWKTIDISAINISGIPFIGNYSSQTIEGNENTPIMDLFEYKPSSYVIHSLAENNDESHEVIYNKYLNVYDTLNLVPVDNQYWSFSQLSGTENYYISAPSGYESVLYSKPVAKYDGYTRISEYTSPSYNVNNVLASRGTTKIPEGGGAFIFSVNELANKIKLP